MEKKSTSNLQVFDIMFTPSEVQSTEGYMEDTYVLFTIWTLKRALWQLFFQTPHP